MLFPAGELDVVGNAVDFGAQSAQRYAAIEGAVIPPLAAVKSTDAAAGMAGQGVMDFLGDPRFSTRSFERVPE
jgi:hypothetical protein